MVIVPPSTLYGRFARLANVPRKLGQVCDPRWTVSRPNDQLLLASAHSLHPLPSTHPTAITACLTRINAPIVIVLLGLRAAPQ
jgi:hypothetical protein